VTGLFRLSKVSEACSPLRCTAEDALRLNATVPFTPWGWMLAAMVYFRIASRLDPGARVSPPAAPLVWLAPLCVTSA
jgi:hypothetical protein